MLILLKNKTSQIRHIRYFISPSDPYWTVSGDYNRLYYGLAA